jgi:cell wall-associated NlpC family hydrolase
MTKPNHYILFLIIIIGIVFYSGCASTSNSVRYANRTESSDQETSSGRYSSENNNTDLAKINNTAYKDTVSIPEDSLDSDPDDIPENSQKIDISDILKKYGTSNASNELEADKSNAREKMLMEIIKYLNTPYKYGGNSKKGIDCSAFTKTIYEKSLSIDLERSARQQYREGEVIRDREDLKFGDLVFFNTRRWVKPGHVGIYIGDNLFAHASSSNGVTVSSLDDAYYSKRFMGGRRIENISRSGSISGIN